MGKFRVRDKEIKVMCTDMERLSIEKYASDNHMSISGYMRKMALEGCIINVDFAELKNLIYEVNRIGNNVNQIAHHVNSDHVVYQSDVEEIKHQIDTLWSLIRAELFRYK